MWLGFWQLTHKTDESQYPLLAAVIDTFKRMWSLKQNEDEELVPYVKQFKAQQDIVKEQVRTRFTECTQEYKDLVTSQESDKNIPRSRINQMKSRNYHKKS